MRTLFLAIVALVVGTSAVAAQPQEGAKFGVPSYGKVLLGVTDPDPAAFDRLTGKHHPLHLMFGAWAKDVAGVIEREHASGRIPVLSLKTTMAPAAIARGGEDARYIALAVAVNQSRENVWVRPWPEMNGSWNPYCAFDPSGRPRGANYSTREFIRAFRRVALIMRGGHLTTINAKLKAGKLPPLRASEDIPRSGQVAVVWNPQGHGTPYIDANGPAAYWPGPGYVDIVGNDLYSDSGEPSWQGMDTLYAYGKPFLVAEWGLKGADDSAFVNRLFQWIASHPRTVGVVYFNKGWSGGSTLFQLKPKRQSLAAYRSGIRSPRFLGKLS